MGWSPASEHVQRSWHVYSSALIYTRVNVFIVIIALCFHRLRHRINTSPWLMYRVLQKLILASILLSFMKSGVFQRSFILTTFLFSWQSFWCLVPSISDTKIECIFVSWPLNKSRTLSSQSLKYPFLLPRLYVSQESNRSWLTGSKLKCSNRFDSLEVHFISAN